MQEDIGMNNGLECPSEKEEFKDIQESSSTFSPQHLFPWQF
jgi:hypothetical protein